MCDLGIRQPNNSKIGTCNGLIKEHLFDSNENRNGIILKMPPAVTFK